MSDEQFEAYAIVEIMGHQTYAGKVSEQEIGGSSFVRVDVPGTDKRQPFTKLFGNGSIYCITPVTEETAKLKAAYLRRQPMDTWDIRQALPQLNQRPLEYDEPYDETEDDDD